jgi:hypothetical protein
MTEKGRNKKLRKRERRTDCVLWFREDTSWMDEQINQTNKKAMSLNICNEVIYSSGGV